MKIGSLVCRKDVPQCTFRIIEDKGDMWEVEPVGMIKGYRKKKGIIFKDDNRWTVVRTLKSK